MQVQFHNTDLKLGSLTSRQIWIINFITQLQTNWALPDVYLETYTHRHGLSTYAKKPQAMVQIT